MPYRQDLTTGEWIEVDAQGNPVSRGQVIASSTAPFEGPTAAAKASSAQAGAQVDQATIPAQITSATASATQTERAAATEGLPPGYMWNRDGTGVIPIPGYVAKGEEDAKQEDRQRKSQVVRSIMGDVLKQYQQSLRGQPLSRAFGATEKIDSLPANESFRATAMGMLALIRPMVAQGARDGDSDKEMEVFLSYVPNNDDSDRTIENKLRNLERLLNGVVDGVMPSEAVNSGRLAQEIGTPVVDGFLKNGTLPGAPQAGGEPPRQMIPGTGGASQLQTATGETYSTPEDVAVSNAINEVYRAGGGIKDMIAASQKFGRPISVQQASEWQRAIDYRDGTGQYQGQPGGFSPVNTPESGRRNLAEQVWGDIGASGPGAFAINAADQVAGGGGLDELTGGINSLFKGTSYDAETAYANLGKQAVSAEHPGFALAGGLAGGIGQGYGIGRLAPKLTSALLKTAPRIAAAGGAYGGLGGALESNNDRLGGGFGGAAIGAGGGLFGAKVAAPALDAISRSAPMQRIARALKIEQDIPAFSPGERSLPQIDQMGGVRTNMQDAARLNLPYALADADPNLRMLAGTVTRKSPNARELAETTFDPRARGQAERAFDAIDTHLAPVADMAGRRNDLLEAGRVEAAPFYQQAYREGTSQRNLADMTRPGRDPELDDLLRTPTGQEAMRRAERIAADSQTGTGMTGLQADGGGVRFVESPNLRTLDLVKRGIDDTLNERYRNPITGKLELDEAGRAIEGFRKRFVEAVDKRFPVYKEARGAYEPFAKRAEALDIGYGLPDTKVRPRDLPRITGGMADDLLTEARSGAATRLADTVSDTRLAGNPYDRIFGTPNQQEKIEALFPNAADFRRTYDLEGDMAKTRYETIGGSPTAARIAADGQMGDMLGAGVEIGADVLTGGGASGLGALINAGRRIAGDSLRMGVGKRAARNAERIAPTLFNTNPADAIAYLDDLALRQAADAVRKGEFRRRGGLFGSTLLSSGALAVPQS